MDKQTLERGRRHLTRRDPVLKPLVRSVGACTLTCDPDGFGVLVRSIISQQISGKAAAAIGAKLQRSLGGITVRRIRKASDEQLRQAGLSNAKLLAVRDLAERVMSKTLRLREIVDWSDEEVIEHLLPVRGIGRWTAEMFLIFSLGRLDVLPVNDFGLKVALQRQFELPEMPKSNEILEMAEGWRPYRTIATWYLWRSLGSVPQSSDTPRA